jgi:hypothetical protein
MPPFKRSGFNIKVKSYKLGSRRFKGAKASNLILMILLEAL